MNQTIKKVNQEQVLFFDLEVVRKNKELDVNSKEYELFRKKIRNKETDELLPQEEVLEQYNRKGALKMCYMKVVSVGVGFIKDGKVHIKALEGDEESILRQFCTIANSFDYVAGANILGYDLPVVAVNGMKYFDVPSNLVDRFITGGKKPWNLDRCLDLMDIFRGTHYANTSVDEMCYHFDLPSPKTEIDGSQISEEYWNNGLEKINKYVKQDVFANINIFKKMRFEEPFETFIDKNENVVVEPLVEEQSLIQRIYKSGMISEGTKLEIEALIKTVTPTEEDKVNLKKILLAHYQQKKDLVKVKKQKEQEINEFIDSLC